MTSWRDLGPVSENVPPRDKASQTLLARQAVCPRSAYLYLKHDGGLGSHEMHRGSAFHAFAAVATRMLVDRDEHQLPWEIGKDIVSQVVADHPEWVIPPDEMDALRLSAYHWCDCTVIDPSTVVAVEKLFELPVGNMRVRGRVDLAVAVEGGVAIRDWKTSLYLPTQAEFDAKVQVPLYALLVGEGYPVREERCDECGGVGGIHGLPDGTLIETTDTEQGAIFEMQGEPVWNECPDCDGTGRVETPEPPIGERFGMFDLSEEYPRLEPWEEANRKVLAYRQRFMTRQELVDHRLYVEGLVAKLEHGLETGEWPAVPGSHCATCPAPADCPLPALLRGDTVPISDVAQAEEVAASIVFDSKAVADRKKRLKAYAQANGGSVRAGSDLVFEFSEVEQEVWCPGESAETMAAAAFEAARTGEEFDYGRFRRKRRSSRFDKRRVRPGEEE